MVYKINDDIVSKEVFETELQKKIDSYVPLSEYWPKKEQLRDKLAETRILIF